MVTIGTFVSSFQYLSKTLSWDALTQRTHKTASVKFAFTGWDLSVILPGEGGGDND